MPRELTDQEKKVLADHRLIADAIENGWELEFISEDHPSTNWLKFHRYQDYRPRYIIRRKREGKPITGELAYLIREWFKRYDTMPDGCLAATTTNIVNRLKSE
jgi:hypothetical protein